MPTPTYTPLANITLGSSAASVTFSSIVGTYRDLVLVIDAIATATPNIEFQLNGDTGNNYSNVRMTGNGSTTGSNSFTGAAITITENAYPTTTSRAVAVVHFMDYSATDKHKSVLSRTNNASTGIDAYAHRWANTAAVTSIKVLSSFAATTTLTLYGIAA